MPLTPEQFAAQLGRTPQPAELLKMFALAARSDTAENFSRSVTPEDLPWLPLRHPRLRGGTKPLLDTGLLRTASSTPGTHHIERFGSNWLEFGVRLIYARLHQFGGTIIPKVAKFLAIPASLEAQRAGSPRRFPRPLVPVFGLKENVGVLIEPDTGEIQYYLSKRVVVPARRFLGVGPRLVRKLGSIAQQWFRRNLLAKGP